MKSPSYYRFPGFSTDVTVDSSIIMTDSPQALLQYLGRWTLQRLELCKAGVSGVQRNDWVCKGDSQNTGPPGLYHVALYQYLFQKYPWYLPEWSMGSWMERNEPPTITMVIQRHRTYRSPLGWNITLHWWKIALHICHPPPFPHQFFNARRSQRIYHERKEAHQGECRLEIRQHREVVRS